MHSGLGRLLAFGFFSGVPLQGPRGLPVRALFPVLPPMLLPLSGWHAPLCAAPTHRGLTPSLYIAACECLRPPLRSGCFCRNSFFFPHSHFLYRIYASHPCKCTLIAWLTPLFPSVSPCLAALPGQPSPFSPFLRLVPLCYFVFLLHSSVAADLDPSGTSICWSPRWPPLAPFHYAFFRGRSFFSLLAPPLRFCYSSHRLPTVHAVGFRWPLLSLISVVTFRKFLVRPLLLGAFFSHPLSHAFHYWGIALRRPILSPPSPASPPFFDIPTHLPLLRVGTFAGSAAFPLLHSLPTAVVLH